MTTRSKRARIVAMIDDVLARLHRIIDKKDASQKNDLWEAYTQLEHAILLLKLDNDFETAGGFEFTRFDKKRSEEELLELATAYLESGKRAFSSSNSNSSRRGGGRSSIESTIDNLRRCRDVLKLLVLKH